MSAVPDIPCGSVCTSACDVAASEGSGQMVDEGAHNRWQATARREDQVDNAILRAPLRENMHQAAARQFASTGVIWQEGHTKPGDGGITKRHKIDAGHPRLMTDRAYLTIRPEEFPYDLAH